MPHEEITITHWELECLSGDYGEAAQQGLKGMHNDTTDHE